MDCGGGLTLVVPGSRPAWLASRSHVLFHSRHTASGSCHRIRRRSRGRRKPGENFALLFGKEFARVAHGADKGEASIAAQFLDLADLRLYLGGVRLIRGGEQPERLLGLLYRAIRSAFREQRMFLGFVQPGLLLHREGDVLRMIEEKTSHANMVKVRSARDAGHGRLRHRGGATAHAIHVGRGGGH